MTREPSQPHSEGPRIDGTPTVVGPRGATERGAESAPQPSQVTRRRIARWSGSRSKLAVGAAILGIGILASAGVVAMKTEGGFSGPSVDRPDRGTSLTQVVMSPSPQEASPSPDQSVQVQPSGENLAPNPGASQPPINVPTGHPGASPTPPRSNPTPTPAHTYGPELSINGGFESGASPWAMIHGTTTVSTANVAYNNPSRAQGGSWFMEMNASEGAGHGSLYEDVTRNTNPGEQYTLSCWVRAPNQSVGGSLALWGLGAGNEAASKPVTADDTWRPYTVTGVYSHPHTVLRIQFYLDAANINYDLDSCWMRQRYS